jgi:hypothetical protein
MESPNSTCIGSTRAFSILRIRAHALQERGVYFSVMLFELYGFLDGEEVNGQRLWRETHSTEQTISIA